MNVINSIILDKISNEIDFSNLSIEFLDNVYLRRYFVLTNCPDKFIEFDSLQIYYNRYYWYLKFLIEYQEKNGYDAGIEQQAFKILQEGEMYDNIEWSEIEQISIKVRKNLR